MLGTWLGLIAVAIAVVVAVAVFFILEEDQHLRARSYLVHHIMKDLQTMEEWEKLPGLEQVAKAPSRVVLYARDGTNDLDLTEDKVHLGTGGAAVKILDLETGQQRSSTLKDLYDIGRLVDSLDHIHFFLRPCIPTDIPEADYDVNMFYACLKATGKHVMSGVNDEAGLDRIVDMDGDRSATS